jgi:hypothetical protein
MLIIESGTAVESKFSESKLFLSLVVKPPRLLLTVPLDPCYNKQFLMLNDNINCFNEIDWLRKFKIKVDGNVF